MDSQKWTKIEGGLERLAELYANGATRREIADTFSVTTRTVTNWVGRDEVKAATGKIIKDRALKIKRRTDSKIEQAIEQLDPVDDIDSILKIRREFAAEATGDAELSQNELIMAAFEALDENPDMAERMQDAQRDAEQA